MRHQPVREEYINNGKIVARLSLSQITGKILGNNTSFNKAIFFFISHELYHVVTKRIRNVENVGHPKFEKAPRKICIVPEPMVVVDYSTVFRL